MKERKFKALFMEVGEEPKFIEVVDKLENLQELVDGFIESVYLGENLVVICNEEGKLRDLDANKFLFNIEGRLIDVLCGNLFACRVDEEGNFADIQDEDIEVINRHLR